ncbi:MAG: hypothetical protein M1827_003416 [Pycnora praestabilis]|nr:MAG: hypothetical protein M1827_003416 [Pycnora praestabilis]
MSSPPKSQLGASESTAPQPMLPPDADEAPSVPAPSQTQTSRLPSLRSASDPPAVATMTSSSTPLGALTAARRPGPPQSSLASMRAGGGGGLPQNMQEKMRAFHLSRQGAPPAPNLRPGVPTSHSMSQTNMTGGLPGKVPAGAIGGGIGPQSPLTPGGQGPPLAGGVGGLKLPQTRPPAQNWISAPAVPNAKLGLGARRGLKLPGGLPGAPTAAGPLGADSGSGNSSGNSQSGDTHTGGTAAPESGSLFNKFSEFVDTKTGTLNFKGKATIHGKGIEFSNGTSFSISLDEVDNLEELGKGNYGTVYKVRHSRPQMRRPGLGLKGNRPPPSLSASSTTILSPVTPGSVDSDINVTKQTSSTPPISVAPGSTTGIVMAMKEIRLELDEAKFAAIIMELDILHRCTSPFIVDFYGAFFQESAVYICMEFMDGGSVDKLYGDGIPEGVLRKITLSAVLGLKSLKDEHNIIHRDVKPTNILVNSRGQIKVCDFGVSGNLVASIAKTNIGCQSYMAPERIAPGGGAQVGPNANAGTYSVQSDIWSLGLSVIECALGRYPYPPETYDNIFSQLSAIVDGDPPDLPDEGFTDTARDFVRNCLNKTPKLRPTYAMLLRHAWLSPLIKPPTITEEDEDAEEDLAATEQADPATADKEVGEWVAGAIERRRNGKVGKKEKPALHAAPLDTVSSPSIDKAD